MHLNESVLRAYIDQELPSAEQSSAELHINECGQCKEELAVLRKRMERVSGQLKALEPPIIPDSAAAYSRYEAQRTARQRTGFFQRFIVPRMRPVFAVVGAILLFVVALEFKPVRAWASGFLSLFRVQQIKVLPIDPANLKSFESQLSNSELSSRIERILADEVRIVKHGNRQDTDSLSQAVASAGFGVRLPQSLATNPRFHIQPPTDISFSIDVSRMQSILDDIGRNDLKLPEDIDGQTVYLNIPSSVLSAYGKCPEMKEGETPEGGEERSKVDYPECKVLAQLPSPTVVAPPELRIPELAKTMLQLLGMSAKQAEDFSQRIDWASTLVIPIPIDGRMQFTEVEVDGVKGTLFSSRYHGPQRAERYNLMWVRDGILYALMGQGNSTEAIGIANSMR